MPGLYGPSWRWFGTSLWGAFHSGAKSSRVLWDRYLTSELYRGILRNTLLSFAKKLFRDNYRYQDDNSTPHCAWVVFDFLQQGKVTKMEKPARSPGRNPINTFGMNWAMQSPVWTTRPEILVSSAKPCCINEQKSL